MKIQIMIRSKSEFRKRNDIALHSLDPSFDKIVELIQDAEKDLFPLIVIYIDKNLDQMSNLKGNSTLNRLRKIFGDVRYGEVTANAGPRSCWGIGTGFTLYLKEVSNE